MNYIVIIINGAVLAACFLASMLNIKLYLAGMHSYKELCAWLGIYSLISVIFAIDTKVKSARLTSSENAACLLSGIWIILYPNIEVSAFRRFFDITLIQLQSIF